MRKYPLILILLLGFTACQRAPTAVDSTPPERVQSPTNTQPPPTQMATLSPTNVPATSTPSPSPLPPLPAIPSPTPEPPFITLLFTGNIVPARCVQAKIDEIGNPDHPYEEVQPLISQVDLAIGTLNATISDYTDRTGCVNTFLLVGGSENAAALANAGFDAMSVATNHIKNCGKGDCGDRAFLDTLSNLQQAGIRPIGAGLNLADALQPQVFTLHGIRFAFVSLGEIESTTFATESTPGIAVLNEANLIQSIMNSREIADVVIALPHWGPEYSVNPNYRQLRFAEIAVGAGADLVVGNHTHTVQAVTTIGEVPVFYGLGNFMFDQDWSRETQQGVALRVTFRGTIFQGYDMVPVHIDGDGRVHVAGTEEALEILGRIEEASQRLP